MCNKKLLYSVKQVASGFRVFFLMCFKYRAVLLKRMLLKSYTIFN